MAHAFPHIARFLCLTLAVYMLNYSLILPSSFFQDDKFNLTELTSETFLENILGMDLGSNSSTLFGLGAEDLEKDTEKKGNLEVPEYFQQGDRPLNQTLDFAPIAIEFNTETPNIKNRAIDTFSPPPRS